MLLHQLPGVCNRYEVTPELLVSLLVLWQSYGESDELQLAFQMETIAIEIEIDAKVVVNYVENENTNNGQHSAIYH